MTLEKTTSSTLRLALGATALTLIGSVAQADQVILDDLIVDGSLCVGFDCVNGESFGFDTIRLKENNTRIKFDDTSTSASFPRNDWQLTANDTSNGGAEKFSIDDITNGRTPFTIEGSAPSHSLFVDDGGRIGFGTSTPVVELHVKDGDTPTLRLEQDGSSGFTPQTWDLAGNETNFFIRDATGGSTLPFRIRPGAPTSAIDVAGSGFVGIGTSAPEFQLDVLDNQALLLKLANSAGAVTMRFDSNDDGTFWNLTSAANNNALNFARNGNATGTEMVLAENGNLTITGALTENSDKNNKMAIQPIDSDEILSKVAALPVSAWTYKHDADAGIRHIGPMAQDFYALFGTGANERGISTLDTSGVALAAIKALAAENAELRARLDALENQTAD